MSDSRTVSGRVEVDHDSRAAVAFRLTEKIGNEEFHSNSSVARDRKYWLTLYRQCWKAANGNNLESVLKQE